MSDHAAIVPAAGAKAPVVVSAVLARTHKKFGGANEASQETDN